MKISVEWLTEKNACPEVVKVFSEQNETDSAQIIRDMIHQNKYLDWGSWLIVRMMTRSQYLAYAIYAAEQVIDIFEKKYPDDKRPRLAIESAKAVLKNDNQKTRAAARAAARDAEWDAAGDAAADAAWAAGAAAQATAWDATGAAARAAAWATGPAAEQKMQIKILQYGLKILEDKP